MVLSKIFKMSTTYSKTASFFRTDSHEQMLYAFDFISKLKKKNLNFSRTLRIVYLGPH